jgi:hypothetical protein
MQYFIGPKRRLHQISAFLVQMGQHSQRKTFERLHVGLKEKSCAREQEM